MTDIYVARLVELTVNLGESRLSPSEENALSDRTRTTLDSMLVLANDIKMAEFIRSLNYTISREFILWTGELKREYYTPLKHLKIKNIDGVFFNIIYCIIDRWQVRLEHTERKRKVSYDAFCKMFSQDTHTLSREKTIHYTVKRIQEIWCFKKDGEKDKEIRSIISSIARDLEHKIERMTSKNE